MRWCLDWIMATAWVDFLGRFCRHWSPKPSPESCPEFRARGLPVTRSLADMGLRDL